MDARGYSQESFQTTPVHSAAAHRGFSRNLTPGHGSQTHQALSQSLGYDGYSSMPRMQKGPNRRKVVNSAIQDYLKSLNSMTRSIVLETESVEKEHQCEWTGMNNATKEEVVDRHFIPDDVRMQYEFERASSCCSFSTGWNSQPQFSGSSCIVENQPLHLSQPNEWEELESPNFVRGTNGQLSRSSHELVYRNHDTHEDLSLSQPSSYTYKYNTPNPQPFNRLHKRQLSLRNTNKINHHPTPSSSSSSSSSSSRPSAPPVMRRGNPRDSLGSDGEGTRTSDEDFFENRTHKPVSPLGFQRNRLRSYSMRSRRNARAGGGGDLNSNPARGSVRLNHRVQRSTSPSREPSRPSHYHSYSNTSTETDTDFDAEIDLPINSLLLDHVYTDSDSTTTSTPPQPVAPPTRYSRQRRSLRKPEQKSTLVIHNVSSSDDNYTDSTDGGVSHFRYAATNNADSNGKIIHNQILVRVGSHDSLDSVSTNTGSVTSKSIAQSDDDILSISEQSRMTPDSMLSSASCTNRPKSKTAEMAIMRNRRGKRGGSSYKMVTSDFADRHTQFKSNMLVRKQLDSAQSSTSTTRAPSPTDTSDSIFLKPISLSLPISKHNSVAESFTSDIPQSPDGLSQLSTPPITPLAITHLAPSDALKCYDENRESGYLSSSSESFHVSVRR